jgi:cytidine deaminase
MRSNKPKPAPELDRDALIRAALDALPNAYAPYSHFTVAAACQMGSGRIYTGVNVENASYPAGTCAERTAIFHAVAEGERVLTAVAIVGGPEYIVEDYCPPCGICRQVMREFADPETCVVILAKSVWDYKEYTLEQLLPESFGPEALE